SAGRCWCGGGRLTLSCGVYPVVWTARLLSAGFSLRGACSCCSGSAVCRDGSAGRGWIVVWLASAGIDSELIFDVANSLQRFCHLLRACPVVLGSYRTGQQRSVIGYGNLDVFKCRILTELRLQLLHLLRVGAVRFAGICSCGLRHHLRGAAVLRSAGRGLRNCERSKRQHCYECGGEFHRNVSLEQDRTDLRMKIRCEM